ncbi:MAG TPA: hypothetical protein VMW69_12615 [Spirochaetia bacterium]|nr:hypothetical protein [Spirochaetia bacterium]
MLHSKPIDEAHARQAIAAGEFADDIVHSSRNVAVVLTQGWCPEWMAMHRWLDGMIKRGEPGTLDIDLYQLIYDRVPYFREFLRFKEGTLGNYEVPYVRYYVDGRLVRESNYCSPAEFLTPFTV